MDYAENFVCWVANNSPTGSCDLQNSFPASQKIHVIQTQPSKPKNPRNPNPTNIDGLWMF